MNIVVESEYGCYIVCSNCMIYSSYMVTHTAGHLKNQNVGQFLVCVFKNFGNKV